MGKRKPICDRCNDTHEMTLGDRMVMCTGCPVPCEKCRQVRGAYCQQTPCACDCHPGRDFRYPASRTEERPDGCGCPRFAEGIYLRGCRVHGVGDLPAIPKSRTEERREAPRVRRIMVGGVRESAYDPGVREIEVLPAPAQPAERMSEDACGDCGKPEAAHWPGGEAETCEAAAELDPPASPLVMEANEQLKGALLRARAEADGLRAAYRDLSSVLAASQARLAEAEERMEIVLQAGPSTALSVSVFDRAKRAEAQLQIAREALLRVNEFADEEFPHLAEIALTALARISKGES